MKDYGENRQIEVQHGPGKITFILPAKGLSSFDNAGEAILKEGLMLPSGDQIASLLHAVYFGSKKFIESPQSKKIKKIISQSDPLWIFNRNLWTNEGLYVVTNLGKQEFTQELVISDLEKKLNGGIKIEKGIKFSRDRKLRFVPKFSYDFSIKYGLEEFTKEGQIIANYGKRGSQKLGEVAFKLGSVPSVFYGGRNLIDISRIKYQNQRSKFRSKLMGNVAGLHFIGSTLHVHNNFSSGPPIKGYALGIVSKS